MAQSLCSETLCLSPKILREQRSVMPYRAEWHASILHAQTPLASELSQPEFYRASLFSEKVVSI